MQKRIKEYARLIVEAGVNIQKGQGLILNAPVECADFAREVVSAAYAAGCREVLVNWRDDAVSRERFLHADSDVFGSIPRWQYHFLTDHAVDGWAFLSLDGSDPDNLNGVDPERLRASAAARASGLTEYRRLQMKDSFQWCIAGVPVMAWAKRVFPDSKEPVAELWNAILNTAEVVDGGDAVERWRAKQKQFEHRTSVLNDKHYKALHYKNSLGIDLTVGLAKNHVWQGGRGISEKGVPFLPNIPTEEIFTCPDKDNIDGIVYSSMPLIHDGNVADRFCFTVKGGRITDVKAERGLEVLLSSLDTDEGARHFGEVALVPYDSPISQMKTLFYDTLYDENASCHFAFGGAYPDTVVGGKEMSESEFADAGGNNSGVHVDFMVGSPDLSIDGITEDGRREPVFRNGTFIF